MLRIVSLNSRPLDPQGHYVLYWMIAARRPLANFALERAVELALRLGRPLLVLEPLRCAYPWASPRLHRFIIDGMLQNQSYFANTSAAYHPYLEQRPGEGSGLVEELARRACAVVTDDFPCFFLPRMVEAVASRLSVAFEKVDSNGLLPMRAAPRVFERAVDFRRFLQKSLPDHLERMPAAEPLQNVHLPPLTLDPEIQRRWPAAHLENLDLAEYPTLDRRATPVRQVGGFRQAEAVLQQFLENRLPNYLERNRPEPESASGLSPYLHFGHISPHQVFASLARQQGWTPARLSLQARGSREGWWGMEPAAESFLDQVVTWRELGYNMCWQRSDYDRYESLPQWARKTLAEHAADPREELYTPEQLEAAGTQDPVWNAAQRQLLAEGRIHNYLRMLWGKKILEWSSSPQEALQVMLELNNRYALDGRNPNSYSGIFWCLGRYDRPWFERPIFGTIRYMSSASTLRKCRLDAYLARWSG